MKIFLKLLLTIMPVFIFNIPALAIDIKDIPNFSSNSILLNKEKNKLTQEQRDLLTSKKLIPTIECLCNQIKKGKNENVEILLSVGLDPNKSHYTEYPIYMAAKNNNFEAVKILYEYGAKLDRGFNSELYEAVKNKNKEMAQYLLDRKARINYISEISNNTILYIALKNNMLDIAKQLIDKGANADEKSVAIIKKKKLQYLIIDKLNTINN